jgi:hypothetical protein
MDWYDVKQYAEGLIGLDMDALHVYAGVLGQIVAALVLRRSLASLWPWLAVLTAALANEWFDLGYEVWPDRQMQYAASFRDLWNTMLLPTLLLVLTRLAPGLFAARSVAIAEVVPRGGIEPPTP